MQSSQYSTAYISVGTKGKKAIGISKIEKDLEIISLILLSVYTDKHEKIIQYILVLLRSNSIFIFSLEMPSGLVFGILLLNSPSVLYAVF